jgi:hypothetical protein
MPQYFFYWDGESLSIYLKLTPVLDKKVTYHRTVRAEILISLSRTRVKLRASPSFMNTILKRRGFMTP